MIDFYVDGFHLSFFSEDVEKNVQYIDTVKKDLNEGKTNLFYLGLHLTDIWSLKIYRFYADELFEDKRYHYCNCNSNVFFAFCMREFGLDKSQVSRYMNIVSEFGDGGRGFAPRWKDFTYSALVELLPLTDDQRKPVQPDWTIKRIREYKNQLEGDVATSQPKDHTVASYALEYNEVRLTKKGVLEEIDFSNVTNENMGEKILEFCKRYFIGFDYEGYGISPAERAKAVCSSICFAHDLSHKFKNEFFHKNISCLIPLLNKAGYNVHKYE